jgi:ornithine cyclodeaminase
VDDLETSLAQAGPIRRAVNEGILDPSGIASLGELLLNGLKRPSSASWTYYNSVGIGVQDAAVVDLLLDRAETVGAGTELPW